MNSKIIIAQLIIVITSLLGVSNIINASGIYGLIAACAVWTIIEAWNYGRKG